MNDFDEWYDTHIKQTIGRVAAKAAWDFQQKRIDETEKDLTACIKLIAIQETKINELKDD